MRSDYGIGWCGGSVGKNDLLGKVYFDLKGFWCQHEGFGLGDTLKG